MKKILYTLVICIIYTLCSKKHVFYNELTNQINVNQNTNQNISLNTQNNWKIFENILQNTSYFLQPPITEQLIIIEENQNTQHITQNEIHLDTNQEEKEVRQSYICQDSIYQQTQSHQNILLLNNNHELIYPGAIFYGEQLQQGIYQPISTKRGDLTFSMSIIGAQNLSATIQNPTLSSVRTAINQILSNENIQDLIPPANYSWNIHSFHSYEQFALSLGIHIMSEHFYNSFQNLFDLDLNTDHSVTKQQFSSTFYQKYYTVDVDIPNNVSFFFLEVPTGIQNISPVYVSSVAYGRTIISNIQSYHKKLRMSLALKNLFSLNSFLSIDGNLDIQSQNTLSNSNIQSTVLGGAGNICNNITNIYSLRECILDGGQSYQTGMPYRYTLRYLKDNTIASISISSKYNATECESKSVSEIPQVISKVVQIQSITSSNNDSLINQSIELYGKIGIKVSNTPNSQQTSCSLDDRTYNIIANIPESDYISVGTDQNVMSYNFRSRLQNIQISPNASYISICTEIKDSDFGIDDLYGYQTERIISSTSIGESNNPTSLRFTNNNNWIELQIHYQ